MRRMRNITPKETHASAAKSDASYVPHQLVHVHACKSGMEVNPEPTR